MNARKIKKLPRLYVEHPLRIGSNFSLESGQSHYLLNVLRKKEDDSVLLFNGRDGEWLASLKMEGKRGMKAVCDENLKKQPPSSHIWFVFAPLKKSRQGFLLEKATELGVAEIIPVQTEYTNLPIFHKKKVLVQCVEAAEQSERLTVPFVRALLSLSDFLKNWPENRLLYVAQERSDKEILIKVIEPGRKVGLMIGPEGGFSEKEIEILSEKSFVRFFSLGAQILRSETAGIVALGLLNHCMENK
ncbi:16S rRNA (uracil(1498)-N(3))-methyltransferase [Alphaproteobacteria bacterium]|nr:16S rRNA (uracil(1498)-N(3))-methyltransferase [Alphaproteobacteria bacterium]